jgi:5-methylcytosine-specific restriction endonuclease McrA
MGRKRLRDTHLPKRVFFRHGTYYYVARIDGETLWTPLGRESETAIARAAELNALKRAERLKTIGDVRNATDEVKQQINEACSGRCVYCGSDQDLGIDHVVPYGSGGSTLPFNLVIACATCNASKGHKNAAEFILAAVRLAVWKA